jgi:hypothetical protein
LSAAVWQHLEGQPGFSDSIAQGEREITEGKSVRFKDIRGGR